MRILLPLSVAPLWISGLLGHIPTLLLLVVAVVAAAAWEQEGMRSRYAGPIIMLLSLNFTAGAADFSLRLLLGANRYPNPHYALYEASPIYRNRLQYHPNSTVEIDSIGNLSAAQPDLAVPRTIVFQTDPFGFRNGKDQHTKPVEILLLGDSYVVGNGTTQEKTWPSLLEKRLGRTVYNLGMPGTPSEQVYTLKTELSRIDLSQNPILLWMLFSGNDLTESQVDLSDIHSNLRRGLIDRLNVRLANFQRRSPTREFLNALTARERAKEVSFRAEVPEFGPMLFHRGHTSAASLSLEEVVHHPNWQSLKRSIDLVREIAEGAGLKLMVVSAPSKSEIYLRNTDWSSSGFASALAIEFGGREIAYFNLGAPLFEGAKNSREQLYWRDDTHWNPEGHAQVVGEILTFLRKNHPPEAQSSITP